MTEKRILALLGFLLGLLAGALILAAAFQIGRNVTIDLDFVLRRITEILIGVVILFGSLLIYRGKSSAGGAINLVLGVVGLLFAIGLVGGVLAIVSGFLGIVAAESSR